MADKDFVKKYLEDFSDLVKADEKIVEKIITTKDILINAKKSSNKIMIFGNGGSAATASHIAADLSWGRRTGDEPRPRTISLVSNSSVVTALGNDVGYENVFVEQLKTLFRAGDVVLAISASGNSENVIRAAEYANNNGGFSIGFVGFGGGKLKEVCHYCVHIKTPTGAYELVEDVHHSVCHMLANYLKFKSANQAR